MHSDSRLRDRKLSQLPPLKIVLVQRVLDQTSVTFCFLRNSSCRATRDTTDHTVSHDARVTGQPRAPRNYGRTYYVRTLRSSLDGVYACDLPLQ